MIKGKENLPLDSPIFLFIEDLLLEKDKTLFYYNLGKNSNIFLVDAIYVLFKDKELVYNMKFSETVKKVKENISDDEESSTNKNNKKKKDL